jgi:uncharacterized membrane protein YgdD (TMEM256/DUF423 family)
MRPFAPLGAGLAGLAVLLGAFGAHVLEARLEPEALATFETGARYQLAHALALLILGLTPLRYGPGVRAAGWLFVAGCVLFSGSLYGLGLGGPRWLSMVAPLGGGSFLAGWLVLTVSFTRPRAESASA